MSPSAHSGSTIDKPVSQTGEVTTHLPTRTWVNDCVEVCDSTIEGRGLFVKNAVPRGTVMLRLGGRLATTFELTRLLDAAAITDVYVDTVAIDTDVHLILAGDAISRFGNHSCNPTLWLNGPIELFTRRELAAGDELTSDYATFSTLPDFSMECRCGSASCRGRITGNDWQLRSLQHRYDGHWSAAARTLIDETYH